ncbi:Phospholipase C 2 [Hordeum vulgare]|uniref:Non-specific phospholipase C6 n=1 Tax=Hordeum vulgare subsp. vulgare TaxID=112509 RepID=A0A8I6X2W6_HORVV|nr:non-specific phospholipase C6-like isoform X1 [Hordeum vulgare subsp. vulgare]KAE8782118.1 Phospholipase C 2 [Hordeum vulgare]
MPPPMGMRALLLLLLLPLAFAAAGNASAGPREASPIKNVVVLALENRSFDHMLGWMRRLLGLPIDGLTGAECNVGPTNSTLPPVCVSADATLVVPDDPGHSFEDVLDQVFGFRPNSTAADQPAPPTMSGFVRSALSVNSLLSSAVMRGFTPSLLPAFSALAADFAVFDRWFSSLPGPTQPNRLFLYSATSHGAVAHDKWNLLRGYPQRTIFDSLAADGRRFNVYFKTIPTTLFYRNLRTVRAAAQSFHFYDSAFRDHARRGRLPALSVIEPRYFDLTGTPADDDHPAHDVANGQRLVKDVYETLRASPQWNDTLLIVTYDEHGGFYDHVATPVAGVPSPDGLRGPVPFFFKFDRLGVRVPTMMVSPWIKKGMVVGRPPNGPTATSEYEHSSIPATIKKIFNLRSDFLTKRDEWAGTFEHIFTQLDQPRTDCPETLPEVPFERTTPAKEHGILSDFQRELVELASFLNGDYMLTSFAQETQKKMTVKQADTYVRRAIKGFLHASRQARRLGANESAIVTMRSSLTSKSTTSRP